MCVTHLALTLETLELLSIKGQIDFIIREANETGGYFKRIEPKQTWDNQRVEIKAHAIFAEGADAVEAIRNWIRAARSQSSNMERVSKAIQRLSLPIAETDPAKIREDCRTIIENGHVGATIRAARATLTQLDAAHSNSQRFLQAGAQT